MVHSELPVRGELESNSHGYSAQPHSRVETNSEDKTLQMHNKQVLQSHSIILLQLQYVVRLQGANRGTCSEKVAKTLKIA